MKYRVLIEIEDDDGQVDAYERKGVADHNEIEWLLGEAMYPDQGAKRDERQPDQAGGSGREAVNKMRFWEGVLDTVLFGVVAGMACAWKEEVGWGGAFWLAGAIFAWGRARGWHWARGFDAGAKRSQELHRVG